MKAKKCKFCKSEFIPTKPLQSVCSFNCAFELGKIAANKKYAKEVRAKKAEMKYKLKTIGDYKKDLQKEINTIVRLIDHDCSCLACGTKEGKFDASHYYSSGAWDNLRWHLFNIYSGCARCNTYLSGNVIKFREGIIREFGSDIMGFIEDLNIQYPLIKMSKIELLEKTAIARGIVVEMKRANSARNEPRTIEQRINLRRIFNQRLGIYL